MLKKILTTLLFLITLQTINPWAMIPLGNTSIWWIVNTVVLFFIIKERKKYFNDPIKNYYILYAYLVWNIICIIRGAFIAENYWEWKNLITMGFVLLLPVSIYISTNRVIVQTIFNQYIRFILPAFFIFAIVISKVAYGIYLIPISFILLFFPLLTKKWKIGILILSAIAVTSSFAARSNVIKFVVPLMLTSLYYLRPFVGKNILGLGRVLLLGLPIILFGLGITGVFNVFKISDYVKGDYKTYNSGIGKQEDLTADTRTGLYVEVLASAITNNYVWFGRTPARGNDSILFGAEIEAQTGTGKFERYVNEVSVLNVFTWTGLIGVFLYFLLFLKATYLALYKSKSWYMKILAVYLSFRWTYAWVEDFSRFDLSYIFLWLIIGMCYSSSFRNMTDGEFKYWIRGVFDIRYRKATLKRVKVIKQ